jgi:hypothetical protein
MAPTCLQMLQSSGEANSKNKLIIIQCNDVIKQCNDPFTRTASTSTDSGSIEFARYNLYFRIFNLYLIVKIHIKSLHIKFISMFMICTHGVVNILSSTG